MKRYRWIIIGLLCMMGIGMHAITRTVDITGAGQYTSIQAAVTASSPGDTILVYPGIYLESISIVQKSDLVICSLEALTGNPMYIESTIIDAQLVSWGMWIKQYCQNIIVRGFSFTNSKVGLSFSNSIASVINCNIHDNIGINGAGLGISFSTVYLGGVKIYNNYAYNMGGGLYIYGYMGTVNVTFDPVNRCSIYNNRAGAGQDIVAHSINNDLSIPLDMFTVANPSSYYAAAYRALGNEFQLLIDANTAHHQEINSDLYVSPEGDDSNDGLSAATALKTIKTAVYRVASDSLNQKTVHVLPGTYSRTANQQVFPITLKSWVKVIGAGLEETQIIGEVDPAFGNILYNPLNVFSSFYQTHASLEDMSITSAGSNNSCALWGCRENYLHLKNLRMHDLSPDQNAVIHVSSAINTLWDSVTIENIVTDNFGFVSCQGSMSGLVKNCIFRNGVNTFSSSEVWGDPLILISVLGDIRFENCIFADITAIDDDSDIISIGFKSILPYHNSYSFVNSLFCNFQSHSRMMIMASPGYPEMDIVNCTFSGNTSDAYILMVNGNINVENSIFYNNSPHEIAINSMPDSGELSTITIDNSLFNGGYNGIQQASGNTINYLNSNIDTDPLFSGGDDIHNPLYYSLSGGSPCVNAGTPDASALNLPPYDMAGNWRVWNNRIDMGCFEYGAEPWVTNDDPELTPIPVSSISAYPNPFRSFTNLKVNLDASKITTSINDANISIYNLKGQRVKSISLDPRKSGEQFTYWDGRDSGNLQCSSGIYFLNLMVNGRNVSSKKVSLIK